MKRIKFASNLAIILALFFIVYNTYFGWNKFPENHAEEICDSIFSVGILFCLAIYISPLLKIYEKWVEKWNID